MRKVFTEERTPPHIGSLLDVNQIENRSMKICKEVDTSHQDYMRRQKELLLETAKAESIKKPIHSTEPKPPNIYEKPALYKIEKEKKFVLRSSNNRI